MDIILGNSVIIKYNNLKLQNYSIPLILNIHTISCSIKLVKFSNFILKLKILLLLIK